MAVTTLAKPGDFQAIFYFPNTTTPHLIMYGVMLGGKIYRQRITKDAGTAVGGPGTWVDTGLTVPDVSTVGDL
jgi:hypothetical protein